MAADQLGALNVILTAKSAEYIAEVKKAKAETASASKDIKGEGGVGGINTVFKKLLAAGLVAKAGKELVQFGGQSIDAASDVEESMSKARTVFGETFEGVSEDLGKFSEATGRSQYDLIGWAATLQDTFVPLGFAREEAAGFSTDIVKLSTDLASFNNLNTADVVRDIQSALVGNTETIRKYGVVASQAFIEQEALNTGLWDGTGAIDAQAKAQAIYQLILKGTTDAQGDAIKTADSLANQQVALESATMDLKIALGNELMPAAKEYTAWAIDAVRWTQDLVIAWGENRDAIESTATEAAEAGMTFDEYQASLGFWESQLKSLNPAQYEQIQLMIENNQLLEEAEQATDGWLVRMADGEDELAAHKDIVIEVTETYPLFGQAVRDLAGDFDALGIAAGILDDIVGELAQTEVEAARMKLVTQIATEDLTAATEEDIAVIAAGLGIRASDYDSRKELISAIHEERFAQLDQLEVMDKVLQGVIDGTIGWEDYYALIAGDGTITLEEYNELMGLTSDQIDDVEQELIGARGQVIGLDDDLSGLDGKEINVGVNINVSGGIPPELQGEPVFEQGGFVGAAEGLDMPVPDGYPNDSFMVRLGLTSGERLMVLTEEQQQGFGKAGSQTTYHFYGDIVIPDVQDAPSFLAGLQDYNTP